MAGILLTIAVILFDQAIKYIVVNNLNLYQVINVIPGALSLMRIHNYGISFSMLQGISSIFLAGVSIAIVLVMAVMLKTRFIKHSVQRWAFVCVIGGALSNAIDRLFVGYVVDMFRLDFVTFGIFNVADIFIVGGSITFVVHWFICDYRTSRAARPGKRERRNREGTFWELKDDHPREDAAIPKDWNKTGGHSLEDYLEGRDENA